MTSLNNSIKFLLDIKDPNIIFSDFYLAKDQLTKILVAKLLSSLKQCPNCHSSLAPYGGYISTLSYPSYDASRPIKIKLYKQRMICNNCQHTFQATSSLVNKHCFIANPSKQKIIQELTTDRSMKDIAKANNVSDHTVLRELTKFKHQPQMCDYEYLSKHLGVDEFRGVKGELHFICIDGDSHRIIKILESRRKKDIKNYFMKFPLLVRRQVKTITMDLNAYYQDLARVLFPNAQIIIDRFHLVQMLNRSFNQLRVQTMKQYEHSDSHYKLLKYYWKFYLKPVADLKGDKLKYYHHLKRMSNQAFIVDEGLDCSSKLRNTYNFLQGFSKALRTKNVGRMLELLDCQEDLGTQMKITFKSFKCRFHLPTHVSSTF
ncbi:ISL3 family transposase [Lactobacillus sp. ESL0791]|uniref:ISL3 family transposase n=1 Tax=Lactobacillus sp. ESL0791 TaxID=2983234 RepID=UPI0023F6768F|nr:ISL3 family transposase [Lactobacillus sp. ESL0791]MDF7638486.1 ISL3 family transposase [Lactobacillus sp. ESL0791]